MYVEWVAHVIGLVRAETGRLPKDLDEVFAHRLPTGRRDGGTDDLFSKPLAYEPAEDGESFTLTSLGRDGERGGREADADVTVRGP